MMPPAASEARPGPVLVVEDRDSLRDAMVNLLRLAEGYQVVTARNGEEALTVLEDVRPCIIVLDLEMPRMDGFDFRRAQLRNPSWRDIPAVAWSADPHRRTRAESLGLRFLNKPADLPTLLAVVREHCR